MGILNLPPGGCEACAEPPVKLNDPSLYDRVWGDATIEQRNAYHRIRCLKSTSARDLELVQPFIAELQRAGRVQVTVYRNAARKATQP